MTASSAPAVLPALTTLATSALADPPAEMLVERGVPMSPPSGDLLIVGFSGPLNPADPYGSPMIDTALQASQRSAQGLSSQRTEVLAVQCVMYATGRDTVADIQDYLYSCLSLLDDALRADPRLSDTCNRASLSGEHSLMHMDSASGWAAALPFTVTVEASL